MRTKINLRKDDSHFAILMSKIGHKYNAPYYLVQTRFNSYLNTLYVLKCIQRIFEGRGHPELLYCLSHFVFPTVLLKFQHFEHHFIGHWSCSLPAKIRRFCYGRFFPLLDEKTNFVHLEGFIMV